MVLELGCWSCGVILGEKVTGISIGRIMSFVYKFSQVSFEIFANNLSLELGCPKSFTKISTLPMDSLWD
jgi:hypothetical protein